MQWIISGIAILLIAIIAWQTFTKARKGSSCCGEHEEMASKVRVADRNKKHYPYSCVLKIEGMVCANCARNVENALNICDGIWAKVDLATRTAKVLSKEHRDKKFFLDALSKTSYILVDYKEENVV